MKKNYSLLLIVSSIALFSLQSLVLEPLLVSVNSNIVWQESIFPFIIEILINTVRIVAYSVCYAVILYSEYRSASGRVTQILLFGASIIYYYAAKSLLSYLYDPEFALIDLYFVLFSLLFDILMQAVILGISLTLLKKSDKKNSMPFEGLFSLSNPLQRSAFCSGIVIGVCRILSRFYYDLQWGSPENIPEIMQMTIYYFSDILEGFLVYLIMTYLFMTFYLKEENKKADR